jgi:hypothetical protein
MIVVYMFLSVVQPGAREKETIALSVVILTLVMPNLPAICASTQKSAGGEDIMAEADKTRDVHAAREAVSKMKSANGSITDAFERLAKGKVTYSHRQHTTTEAR